VKIMELNATDLKKFFSGGCAFLCDNKEQVNALNVFPVPDGDTGTNMSLTMTTAIKDFNGQVTAAEVLNRVSNGALMGARGNSGVILSQIFRGFAQGVGDKGSLDPKGFAVAMQRGVDLAYRAVMRPVEGTMLTVSKEMAKAALASADAGDDMIKLLEKVIDQGKKALANTPNQLPVLKQAGVVDAGGQGLILIYQGGLKALLSEEMGLADEYEKMAGVEGVEGETQIGQNIEFGYCTEVMVHGKNIDVEPVRETLTTLGDSLVVVGTESLVKVHVHTNDPGAVFSYLVKYGSLHDIKVDNMRDQHREILDISESVETKTKEPAELAECGVVVVVSGDGLTHFFTELGAGYIINGGQSMNPSAEDLLRAFSKVPAKEIIILPNNSNIILTAQQAKELAERPVHIVPTKYITQGISAMVAFNSAQTAAANVEGMLENIKQIKSGEVTYAVRNSTYDGLEITENDILGLEEGKLLSVGEDLLYVVLKLVDHMLDGNEDQLLTLFYGADLKEEEAQKVADAIMAAHPQIDLEMQSGGQPLYYFLISVE